MIDLSSRKFWIAIVCIGLLTILCFIGRIDGTAYVAGLGVVFGFYSAGNILDKVVSNDTRPQ